MATEVQALPTGNGGYDGSLQGWDGQTAKLAQALALTKTATGLTRPGVVRGGGNLAYTLNGLNGTLQPGVAVIPAATGSGFGAHALWRDTAAVLTHPTADVSQPRTDLIIGEVQDFGGLPVTVRRLRILVGTPGASAPAPTLTSPLGNGGWIILHSVRINAGATTGTVTDLRRFTVAAGGNLPVKLDTEPLPDVPPGTIFTDVAAPHVSMVRTSTGSQRLARPAVKLMPNGASPLAGNAQIDLGRCEDKYGQYIITTSAGGHFQFGTDCAEVLMSADVQVIDAGGALIVGLVDYIFNESMPGVVTFKFFKADGSALINSLLRVLVHVVGV